MRVRRSRRWLLSIGFVLVVALAGAGIWFWEQLRWEDQEITRVEARSASATISVVVAHSSCGHDPKVRLDAENAEMIRLSARLDVRSGCDDEENFTTVEVSLDDPLGERRIDVDQPEQRYRGLACVVDDRRSDRCRNVGTEAPDVGS